MLRLVYICIVSLPFILFYFGKAAYIEKHSENYDEYDRYKLARRMLYLMKRIGFIHTDVYGTENLPDSGGYIMYANHQGKYDTVGIMDAHNNPCTVLIDEKTSREPLVNEFINLVKGSRLDKTHMESQLKTILNIIKEVKDGRRYIIFPEGGYTNNHNHVQDFLPGSFKCATKSRCPIVPVALIDSYKPFAINSLRKVRTQVHFLEPLLYDDYKDLNTQEIALLVKDLITNTIDQYIPQRECPEGCN